MQTYIVPVSVYPGSANVLYIRAGNLGPPPSYYYQLQNVTIVPPVPEQVDPTTGEVIVPASPEQTQVVVLKDGNIDMTQAQWAAWPADADDDEYQLNAISANLGLTRA
jgi:hypothetical protein